MMGARRVSPLWISVDGFLYALIDLTSWLISLPEWVTLFYFLFPCLLLGFLCTNPVYLDSPSQAFSVCVYPSYLSKE